MFAAVQCRKVQLAQDHASGGGALPWPRGSGGPPVAPPAATAAVTAAAAAVADTAAAPSVSLLVLPRGRLAK
eukprot:scaffold45811_cov69-Phaeocystis_antarctica.AAC.1